MRARFIRILDDSRPLYVTVKGEICKKPNTESLKN